MSSIPTPHVLRGRREERSKRLLALDAVVDALVSVANLVNAPVRNQAGAEVGRVVDVVVRWEGESYPGVTGLVVKVGRRLAWVSADQIDDIAQRVVRLGSARLDLNDFERRSQEVKLVDDVVDHQMVDVDGVRVFRAADLYLAKVGVGYRLVGADVGFGTLVRRLAPVKWRGRPTPDRVIDWAAIQPFSDPGEPVRLTRANQELHKLRPGELADLLEELGRSQRQELLAVLDAEAAADALEEMESDELVALLREFEPERAAELVAEMEPDEAADALRDLDEDTRAELLEAMSPDVRGVLTDLLAYDEEAAGGLMTTTIVVVEESATVAEVRRRVLANPEHHGEIDGVLVVDDDGALVDDVRVIELFVAEPDQTVGRLSAPPWPVTVTADEPIEKVIEAFIENRGSSVVVVDEGERPVGRILADDVVDALVPDRGRFTMSRLLP